MQTLVPSATPKHVLCMLGYFYTRDGLLEMGTTGGCVRFTQRLSARYMLCWPTQHGKQSHPVHLTPKNAQAGHAASVPTIPTHLVYNNHTTVVPPSPKQLQSYTLQRLTNMPQRRSDVFMALPAALHKPYTSSQSSALPPSAASPLAPAPAAAAPEAADVLPACCTVMRGAPPAVDASCCSLLSRS